MAFDIEKYFEEEAKKKSEFKARLAKEYGVENHPKLDRLYEVTWDLGPIFGFNEDRYVTIRFKRFGDVFKKQQKKRADLIK